MYVNKMITQFKFEPKVSYAYSYPSKLPIPPFEGISPLARQQLRTLGVRLKRLEDRERRIYKTMTALVKASKTKPELVEKWVSKRVPKAPISKLLAPTPSMPTPPSIVSWVKDKVSKAYRKVKSAFSKAKKALVSSGRKIIAGAKWTAKRAAGAISKVFKTAGKGIASSIKWLGKKAYAGAKWFPSKIKSLREKLKTASPEERPFIEREIKDLETAQLAAQAEAEYPQAVAQEAALQAEEASEALEGESSRFKNILPLALLGTALLGLGIYMYMKK